MLVLEQIMELPFNVCTDTVDTLIRPPLGQFGIASELVVAFQKIAAA